MIERSEDPCFAFEACEAIGVARESTRQNLDCDVASERRVARAVYLPHPAHAKRRDDFVRANVSVRAQNRLGLRLAH